MTYVDKGETYSDIRGTTEERKSCEDNIKSEVIALPESSEDKKETMENNSQEPEFRNGA